MASFAVKFLGCKVSQADAMLARRALLAAGHVEAPESEADLHVVNTCCITAEAEAKSRQSVRRSLKLARQVYVSGCAVNLDARRFADLDERVTALVGTADEVALRIGGLDRDPACADLEHGVLSRTPAAAPDSRTRGFVKVQDGCDCHCAYCIIPAVRGAARSRPAGAILREVSERVDRGQPEMVMTGISVGDYRDPERGLELGELMVEVARVPGVERVRLSSVEVIHVKDSLLRALVQEPRICLHLHVPLQSGDDGVLAAMGRHYTAAEYLDHIARLRAAVRGRGAVNVTTDVIVGFPTEDEAAFGRTLAAVDAAGITRVHAFSYSPRPGTAAAALGDRVPAPEKKRRSQALRARSEVRSRLHRSARLGRTELVLVDKVAETQCSGYTADYTRCYLPAGAAPRGALVLVRCVELHADGIRCEVPGA
ncbi:MAG: MiaB/RimO family radical SAM methylthiotransferase [Solirubrobacteraceae bacterium]